MNSLNRTTVVSCLNPIPSMSYPVISRNLLSFYRRIFPDSQYLDFRESYEPSDSKKIAQAVEHYSPELLIFTDFYPHGVVELAPYLLKNPTRVIFHTHGKFLWRLRELLSISKLKDLPCHFISPCSRHDELLKRYFETPPSSGVFPIPLNEDVFLFSKTVRDKKRKELEVSSEEPLMIYAGRFNAQKNIPFLIREVGKFLQTHPGKLLLVGLGDDLGIPRLSEEFPLGFDFQCVLRELKRLNTEVAKRVIWLPAVESKELSALFNASDLFVSFSLNHFEEFGMAPAEALLTGLPLLLTDWGGYADLVDSPQSGRLVPVNLSKSGLRVDSAKIPLFLEEILKETDNQNLRMRRSKNSKDRFGYNEARIGRLKAELASNFLSLPSFSSQFKELYLNYLSGELLPEGLGSQSMIYRHFDSTYLKRGDMQLEKEGEEVTEEWYSDFQEIKSFRQKNRKADQIFGEAASHLTQTVFSSVNAVFLFNVTEQSQIFSRDGLIPLLHFFYRNPKPTSLSSQVGIPDPWREVVPESWRERTFLYRIQIGIHESSAQILEKAKRRTKLLVHCFCNPLTANEKSIEKCLEDLDREVLPQIQEVRLILTGDDYLLKQRLIEFFEREISGRVSLGIWEELLKTHLFSDTLFLNLNHGLSISDDFALQQILSKGGLPIELNRVPSFEGGEPIIPLSCFHGYATSSFAKAPPLRDQERLDWGELQKKLLKIKDFRGQDLGLSLWEQVSYDAENQFSILSVKS